ncbi:hypothetical protein JL720_58 [Aureococcus anophagefferens]|nr:hypothetical protein JL720_58 [Aureococcus anophagefferens]
MWRVVVAASLAAASLAAASPAASPNATRRERVALAALVVSGHKAADEGFVQQSACAALALFASARRGGFGGDGRSSREPFASAGFDGVGDAGGALRRLWDGGAFDPPGAPPPVPRSCAKARASCGTTASRSAPTSLTYAALPLVHYNAPGPKPWAAHAEAASADVAERQRDFAWWAGFAAAAAGPALRPLRGAPGAPPREEAGRAPLRRAGLLPAVPGRGHFATARRASRRARPRRTRVVAAELEDAAALALCAERRSGVA